MQDWVHPKLREPKKNVFLDFHYLAKRRIDKETRLKLINDFKDNRKLINEVELRQQIRMRKHIYKGTYAIEKEHKEALRRCRRVLRNSVLIIIAIVVAYCYLANYY